MNDSRCSCVNGSWISIYMIRLTDSITGVFETKPREAYARYWSDVPITASTLQSAACKTDL